MDSSRERVRADQSMVGLVVHSQGSPRITLSLRDMTWKTTFWVIPSMLVKRVQEYRISPFLLRDPLAFREWMGSSSLTVGSRCFLTKS